MWDFGGLCTHSNQRTKQKLQRQLTELTVRVISFASLIFFIVYVSRK